ncbi:MAG: ferrochelatase, partial [Chloroflexi bacterium]
GELHKAGVQDVVILPLGFISDHMEVLYDLDTEALQLAEELGMNLVRAATVGTHPRFIQMIRELIVERMEAQPIRSYLGKLGPVHDICPANCCLSGRPINEPHHHQRPSSSGKA